MARNTGPRARRARRLGIALSNLTKKDPDKDGSLRRPYPPGQHGQARTRQPSEYARRLLEKQKLKLAYELLEHQCQRVVAHAKRAGTNASTRIIELLEQRFDVAVWRAGFATSLRQARQMVRHGNFLVNGKKANFPSEQLTPGTVVSIRVPLRTSPLVVNIMGRTANDKPPAHLKRGPTPFEFQFVSKPTDAVPPVDIDLMRVIEFYA